MRQVYSESFAHERERFALRFTCEECAFFIERRETCAHGYPVSEHRGAKYEGTPEHVIFCKEFDLA